jgi:acyl dehydratase
MNDVSAIASIERVLTQHDFDEFAALSGDDNPIHVDPEFSARTRFGRTVSHGMLLATVLRGLVDRILPGATQLSQDLQFPAPTYADELMRFSVEVVAATGDTVTVGLDCRRVDDDIVTCTGQSVLQQGNL